MEQQALTASSMKQPYQCVAAHRKPRRNSMRNVFLPSLLLLFLCVAVQAAAPSLKAGTLIYAGSTPMVAGFDSCPEVADWNGDGKKDLIVGSLNNAFYGEIYIFLNQGTDAAPSFGTSTKVQSGGAPLKVGAS
jgi:hypothetical protein